MKARFPTAALPASGSKGDSHWQTIKQTRPLAIQLFYGKFSYVHDNFGFYSKKCYKYVKHHLQIQFRSPMILIAIYYLIAIVILTLHFTGHLERWNCEWLVFVMALTVFPAVLYL